MDGPTDQVVDAYEDKYDPEARSRRVRMVDEAANADDSSAGAAS
jgi:hypothetical protein